MRIEKKLAWEMVESQIKQMKAALKEVGVETLSVRMERGLDGEFVVDWKNTGNGNTLFKKAMAQHQANGPLILSASRNAKDYVFFQDFHDREHNLREAAEVALENAFVFVSATSGFDSVTAVDIIGPIDDETFPLVIMQGTPFSCGWNPPEFKEDFSHLPEITAYTYSDDHKIEVQVDARPYLKNVSLHKLKQLIADDWQCDYSADEIYHEALLANCAEAGRLAAYLELDPQMENGDEVGFEVSLDEGEARAWIAANRPDLHEHIKTSEQDAAPSL
ncbi:hypothetical protein KUV57_12230 [Epibacterium sp. DP7N7-1]|nr:hypothetical protein [Epibacterium sp. DP7N7-1]